jgi:hypothetical protein
MPRDPRHQRHAALKRKQILEHVALPMILSAVLGVAAGRVKEATLPSPLVGKGGFLPMSPVAHFANHGDDVKTARAQMRQHRAQEFRRDLKMAIGLEFGVTGMGGRGAA